MVNEMIDNNQQGIVVVATNIDQLAKPNDKLFWQDIPFTMMINSNEYMKKKITIGEYSICSFHSKKIKLDDITIDGCVYAVDCVIDGIGNCHITQQLIHTGKSVIRYRFNSQVITCNWPIDPCKLIESGINLSSKSKFDEAIEFFRFALCVRLQILPDSDIDVAESYDLLGKAYHQKGGYETEANIIFKLNYFKSFEEDLEIHFNKIGSDYHSVVNSHNNVGLVRDTKGIYDKAIECLEKSLEIRLNKLGLDPLVADSYCHLAGIYDSKGEYDKAIKYFENTLNIWLNKRECEQYLIAILYNNLGSTYDNKGKYNKAIEYYEKSLQILLNKPDCERRHVAISYNNLGLLYNKNGEYNKAIEYCERSLNICCQEFGHNHFSVANSKNNLTFIYYGKQEYEKAMQVGKQALELRLKRLGSNHPDVGVSCDILGDICYKQKNKIEAKNYYENALSIFTQQLGESHQTTSRVRSKLNNL
ncbi:hypothetical protein RFI_09935 [Reticulomyxa filosa]|uniref:Uncharacterized protein n=1 Tax=Reticulomyxa filosa TaxID=46433 RepID=X6NP99_RETFI|nr:hypothetical protein RFI_09935 [Reticulomyxa filosa]|eukprot:ETO27197.1 hypothetical protein RFI_09935 [Reticulomyxa filosa]